jgi:hypothetical protein
MEIGLFGWADLAMNAVQVVALGAVLWLLLNVHRGIMAMLRVLRRMDRKTPDTVEGTYGRPAKPY